MLILPAPAKVNLFLHIVGRRPDGYHELQTLFQLLDYGDKLTFDTRGDGEIRLETQLAGVEPENNLIVKAARALQSATGARQGASITLDKRLPMGGGIGGGSSDAATTLLALNSLWKTNLGLTELANIGGVLGADIPVFVCGKTAWAEGTGDRLQPVEIPSKWYVVLTPSVGVSTAGVFNHPELTRDSAAITVAAFFEQGTRNDCQPLVEKLYPEVADVVNWLQGHSRNTSGTARMTGTGASVFVALDSEADAKAILADSTWRGFVAKGINESPVHALLPKI
ncbi:4-(cytidine 5'-diphospho)-2-C-methyl-D-erythritol kinase [Proteobacteria bacterium 005FR1]|nr:4-(cytidine 5'-diphospho)-2-C-methyl-D-erythritol kinase [Proteobacteria bacterium 005FR1]